MRLGDLRTSAMMLLEDLRDESDDILAHLTPGQRGQVQIGLMEIGRRADGVATQADESKLIDAVHRLVEDMPPLREWLLETGYDVEGQRLARMKVLERGAEVVPGSRLWTMEDDLAADAQETHAQQFADDIRNLLVDVGDKLNEIAVRNAAKNGNHPENRDT